MGDGRAAVRIGILVATVVGLWIGVRLLVDSGARSVVIAVVMIVALWTGRQPSWSEGASLGGSEIDRWIPGVLGLVGYAGPRYDE